MVNKTKTAFTLAEVLITLVIIGIVAALTIPTAINNYRKHEYYSAFKKTYSTLLQATNKIFAEHGSPNASIGGWASLSGDVKNMYKKYLNAKDCTVANDCFAQYKIRGPKYISGDNYTQKDFWQSHVGFVLSDGTQIVVAQFSSSCNYHNHRCFEFWTDINGQKGPNQWGRDVFVYAVTENGFEYDFSGSVDCDPNGSNKVGYGCAAKLLRENAMNY